MPPKLVGCDVVDRWRVVREVGVCGGGRLGRRMAAALGRPAFLRTGFHASHSHGSSCHRASMSPHECLPGRCVGG
jgi:hypothetical protein